MSPRIAIPQPTSADLEYNRLNWPAFAEAVLAHGGEPVEVPLDLNPRRIAELANTCAAILLPGSPADVNPAKYGQMRDPESAPADLARENVDELLLQDAHNLFKPILGICFGAQMLNVWRGGTLIQDLTILPVNHSAARGVMIAHTVSVQSGSLLESCIDPSETASAARLSINSSHHQAIGIPGDGLMVSARCPQDGVIEAVEGAQHSTDRHFVLGLQWHPERSVQSSGSSRLIFGRLVEEARSWVPRAVTTSVVR